MDLSDDDLDELFGVPDLDENPTTLSSEENAVLQGKNKKLQEENALLRQMLDVALRMIEEKRDASKSAEQ